MTDFIDATDGVAIGDLRGAVGVVILRQTSGKRGTTILHVPHHWVTETGDTISFDDADVTLVPTYPCQVGGNYLTRFAASRAAGITAFRHTFD